jgi:signal transduction histidine kinase
MSPSRSRPEALRDRHAGARAEDGRGIPEAVREAADAVMADPSAWQWHALDPAEAEKTMSRLVSVVCGEGTAEAVRGAQCGSVVVLGLRLSELLRQELLQDPRGLDDASLLETVRRIENCRVTMHSRSEQELTYLLTGANALELVVEFAHDLRSPLTSIMFLAETLRKGQSGEINAIQRDQLGIMYSAALGMVGVANDLMDMASSEADAEWGGAADEVFSLQELVENVRNMVAPMAEQKRLAFAFYTPESDTRTGNSVLLSRVLLNLVTNAIKFTDQGRVEIVVEERPGHAVLFTVRDTGRGMSPEDIESLYTMFGRAESRTGYHFSGTGLGLSICRRMVQKMGGRLHVESQRGGGTSFFFELDLPRS